MWDPPRRPELVEGAAEVAVQTPELGRIQRSRRPGRVEAGPPQQLVGEQVPEAGEAGLVHEPGLQRGVAAGEDARRARPRRPRRRRGPGAPRRGRARRHRGGGDRAGAGPCRRRSGRRSAPMPGPCDGTAYSSWSMASTPSSSSTPVMPKRRPEGRAVVAGVEQQQLAPAPVGDERAPHEGGHDLGGRGAALQEPGVGRVDGDDRAPERRGGRPAVDLDLQHLRHGRALPAPVGSAGRGDAVEGLGEVGDEVVGVLEPDRHPDRARADAVGGQLVGGEVDVGGRRRVGDQRLGPAERGGELGDVAAPRRTCSRPRGRRRGRR